MGMSPSLVDSRSPLPWSSLLDQDGILRNLNVWGLGKPFFPIGDTVASRPEILQNNTKPAPEKNGWLGKIASRMAQFSANVAENQPKKYLMKNVYFF
jgi:hypothetical protein